MKYFSFILKYTRLSNSVVAFLGFFHLFGNIWAFCLILLTVTLSMVKMHQPLSHLSFLMSGKPPPVCYSWYYDRYTFKQYEIIAKQQFDCLDICMLIFLFLFPVVWLFSNFICTGLCIENTHNVMDTLGGFREHLHYTKFSVS